LTLAGAYLTLILKFFKNIYSIIKNLISPYNFRSINKYLVTPKSKLETLGATEHMISKDCYFTSFDIRNCYFHVKLHPKYRKYFSFKIKDENGLEKFFTFLVMCYGVSVATEVINRLTRPLKSLIHQLGIVFSIYIGKI
jgi:hypothetical protein